MPKVPIDLENLKGMLKREFPGAISVQIDAGWQILTLHGQGTTEAEAIQNTLKAFKEMQEDGRSLRQILDDVIDDLKASPGMGRQRHDSLIDLLNISEKCLNDGILTGVVPFIMVASYNREIEDLKHRVDTRLNMQAVEFAQNEEARKRAGTKFPRTHTDDALTPYERLWAKAKK
jgi:hypothetical protein